MDELAQRSLLVQNAYAVVGHTHNALVATNCGVAPPLDPRGTNLLSKPGSFPSTCLAHLLQEQGYNTVYFMSQDKSYENSQKILENLGYKDFYSIERMSKKGFERTNYFGYEDEIMLEPSRAWLEKHRNEPFLAAYLTSAPHHDYLAPHKRYGRVKFTENDLVNRYLNTIRNQDFFLEKLFDQYKQLGLYEETIFVVLGDHGEGFGEHGLLGHNMIYEEGLRVPLLIHDPKRFQRGAEREGAVDQLDILPTIVDMLGYEIQGGAYDGSSLLDPLRTDRTLMFSCWGDKGCLASLTGTQKYIYHFDDKPEELFDLATDPGERHNLAGQRSAEELNKRRAQLLEWRAKVHARYGTRPAE
jgi:arylsulfatase A-like enzyme